MGVGPLKKAVFLDRDGVLNEVQLRDGKPHPPDSVSELRILPGVADALQQLREKQYLLIVVTNQPDVARGKQFQNEVEAIHRVLSDQLAIDEFRVCYHDDAQECACRKPKPGLLIEAAMEHGIDLSRSYMVGDRWRDVEAGFAAGCRSIWIDRGYRERGPKQSPEATVQDLAAAAAWILRAGD